MNKWHKELNLERWSKFSQEEQVLMIATEMLRAKHWFIHKDIETVKHTLERALELFDLTVSDPRWKGKRDRLLQLREAVGYLYCQDQDIALVQLIYNGLMDLSRSVSSSAPLLV